ncbi:MAG: serine/threonine protein kinase [Treponema sp.]|nr:serine/threonine protein kinase [Treponema sp.]
MNENFPPAIGKYKIMGVIAQGGMGVVYKAIHPSLKRGVVIKQMKGSNKGQNAERFEKEAKILLDLNSPYIVHLFDYFREGNYRFMVEELVDGFSLDNLINRQYSLPVPLAMLITSDACNALKTAHNKNIIHRDIKPGNILISKTGQVKLADFGIATETQADDNITSSGVALGTPAYMPPEQYEDSARVDNRADIYALGIMLYEMVTGTKPYPGSYTIETLKAVKKGKYIKPRKIDKTIPKEVQKIIVKMIKPKAKNRYQTIEQVSRQIKKYLKHYDTHEIRVQLSNLVRYPKQYKFPPFVQKDRKIRIIRRSLLSVFLISALGIFSWKSGLIHEFILRPWYKSVNFEIVMPNSLFAQMDLPLKITFFENDNDTIPLIKGSSRKFSIKGSRLYEKIYTRGSKLEVVRPASKNKTYTMYPVWLKKGDYRAKIVVGPYVWWKSFTVSDQPFLYTCDFLKNMKRPLHIQPYAFDKNTMENISERASFKMNYKNRWVDISEVPLEEITSATVWKIKVSCPDYEDEVFSLLIDWYQDELILSAALKPLN